MSFSFPTSPSVNELYTFGNKTWRYNGTGWELVTNIDVAQTAWDKANLAAVQANTATVLAQGAFDNSNTKFSTTGGSITGNVSIAGNLSVSGNISYTGNVTSVTIRGNSGQFFGNTTTGFNALYAGLPTGYLIDPQTVLQLSSNYDGYTAISFENQNHGQFASADLFLTPDNGSANDTFLDVGIGSSTYNYPGYGVIRPNDAYVIAYGNTNTNGGNLILNSALNDIMFVAGGTDHDSVIMRVQATNNVVIIPQNPSTSIDTGVLVVGGGVGVAGNVYAGAVYSGSFNYINGVSITDNANAAFLQANAAYQSQNTTGFYANSAYSQANGASLYANGAFTKANAAYQSQNTTGTYANSAFLAANTADSKAVTAGSYANSAYTQANTATNNAAGASLYANGAFVQANAAYQSQNTTGSYANNAFLQANASFGTANSGALYANSAFLAANAADSKAVTAGSYANSAYTQANTATTNAATADSKAVTAGSYANSAYTQANTATNNAAGASLYANGAFIQANASFGIANSGASYANSAFTQANAAYEQANSAGSYANSAFLAANTADSKAVTAGSYANSGYIQANTATNNAAGASLYANAAFIQANAAFAQANTSSGGSGKTYTFYQNTAPSSANTNDLWMNSDTGTMYENVNGATPTWVEFGPTTTGASTVSNTDLLLPFLLMSI